MVEQFIKYYEMAHATQQYKFEKTIDYDEFIHRVPDPLIRNVPIYDVVQRRYAAFSSFPEALRYGERDPKGNGKFFTSASVGRSEDFKYLLYLFRLCGSGINYIPRDAASAPWGTHGFGNFWLVDAIRKGYYRYDGWINQLPEKKFCDVKGYMLPLIKGGIYDYINDGVAKGLVDHIWERITYPEVEKYEIYEVVEIGNKYLKDNGYNKQNFVLCAFAMDIAEYFPNLVSRTSRVLVGSNAKKCLKQIFPAVKGMGTNLDVTNKHLDLLCNMTGNISEKYDMEDVACDFIRYINNYQSPAHIAANNGIIYENNVK